MSEFADRVHTLLEAFQLQVDACNKLGSPFTAKLVEILRDDIKAAGPWAALVADWPGSPLADAVSLRCTGALHALVLTGQAPRLAKLYPPTADTGPSLVKEVKVAAQEHKDFIARFLVSPPQTNEVGRSDVLIGGFLEIAKETGLPLSTLEIGASAGLNLNWDRFHYRLGAATWGDPKSPLTLTPEWKGGTPPMEAKLAVARRAGCDIAPIDITNEETRIRLKSYVWPDQADRLKRLDAAIGIALSHNVQVEKADAKLWLERKLREESNGVVRTVYHSIMWQYMPKETRDGIRALIEDEGGKATKDNPVAWLRFEPDDKSINYLTLSLWPKYGTKKLAKAHPHGTWVEWLE